MSITHVIVRIVTTGVLAAMFGCGGGGGGGGSQSSSVPTPMPQGSPQALIDAPPATTSYMTVQLDGSASSDATSTLTTYQWSQSSGPTVTLENATAAQASFVAPNVSAPTPIGIKLSVTDQNGTGASQSATLTVNPPSASQRTPAFINVLQLVAVSGNPHLNAVPVNQTLVAGTSTTHLFTLAGALQNPTVTLEDAHGNTLGTVPLTSVGDASQQPLNFVGTYTVPSVPFQYATSGTSADGQAYSLSWPGTAAGLLIPAPFGVSFNVQKVRLNAASPTYTVTATLINTTSSPLTLQEVFSDPAGVDPSASANPPVITLAAGATQTVPLTLTFPANPPAGVSTFSFGIVNNANPSQLAFASLTLLLAN